MTDAGDYQDGFSRPGSNKPRKPAPQAALRGFLLCGLAVLLAHPVIAKADDAAPAAGRPLLSFRYTGGMGFGEQSLSIGADGSYRLMLGDTSSSDERQLLYDDKFSGIGVFEGKLSAADSQRIEQIRQWLCRSRHGPTQPVQMDMAFHPSSRYATTCDDGALDITPYAFAPTALEEVNQSMLELKRSLYRNGRKRLKLDVQVDGVENHRGRYRVTLRFLNGGEQPITVKSPSSWQDDGGYRNEGATIDGKGPDGKTYRFMLAGKDLAHTANRNDPLVIPPGESRQVVFLAPPPMLAVLHGDMQDFVARPATPLKHGDYDFKGEGFMHVSSPALHEPTSEDGTQVADFYFTDKTIAIERNVPALPAK